MMMIVCRLCTNFRIPIYGFDNAFFVFRTSRFHWVLGYCVPMHTHAVPSKMMIENDVKNIYKPEWKRRSCTHTHIKHNKQNDFDRHRKKKAKTKKKKFKYKYMEWKENLFQNRFVYYVVVEIGINAVQFHRSICVHENHHKFHFDVIIPRNGRHIYIYRFIQANALFQGAATR